MQIDLKKVINSKPQKKNIYFSIGIFTALFVMLAVYINIVYFKESKELLSNSYNKQESNLMKKTLRGSILSSDGTVLAYSRLNADGSQTRVYPYGSVFCHAVGYNAFSKNGIEAQVNYYLLNTGDSVLDRAQKSGEGSLADGYTAVSTLNTKLQVLADQALGEREGAVFVTDVKTGKILALVSHPVFDPNNIEEDWDYIAEDDSSPLLNRVTQGFYPPGSVFKIFTAYEYYREGMDYESYGFDCNGYFSTEDYRISCFHGGAHGHVDFETSFAKSCNSSFANIGTSLNDEEFKKGLSNLLFDAELPAGFYNRGVSVSSYDISSDFKKLQTSIGQGDTSVSPYHINLVTMAIANGGELMVPYIVDSIEDSRGLTIKKYHPESYGELLTDDESMFLKELMRAVVTKGTGSQLGSDIYEAAGKTGSAEYNNHGDSHGWFTGFAPVDNPEIAITVIVERGGTGSESAVPIAKQLFDLYFEEIR